MLGGRGGRYAESCSGSCSLCMAQDHVLDLAPQTKHVGNRGTVFFWVGGRNDVGGEVRRTVLR